MGIIPRISHDIFDHIYSMDENLEFHIKVNGAAATATSPVNGYYAATNASTLILRAKKINLNNQTLAYRQGHQQ